MLADKAMFDIVILTDNRYVNPTTTNWYIDQVLLEDQLLQTALENKGLKVCKKRRFPCSGRPWRKCRKIYTN